MILIPRVSEKTYAVAANGTYVFNVPMTANKQQIIAAVTSEFSVKVKDVRTVIIKGKSVRSIRAKGQAPRVTLRSKRKKAYVTLADGATLNLFNEEASEEKK